VPGRPRTTKDHANNRGVSVRLQPYPVRVTPQGTRLAPPQRDWGLNSIGSVVSTGPAADRQVECLWSVAERTPHDCENAIAGFCVFVVLLASRGGTVQQLDDLGDAVVKHQRGDAGTNRHHQHESHHGERRMERRGPLRVARALAPGVVVAG
jgi:hypothetical protein